MTSSSTTTAAVAATAAAVASAKICFNVSCKEPLTDKPRRRGWRLRSGEHADLCERCSSTYEQGNFCETFHSDVDGWRMCESCGKRVHCGCIVSVATFRLLDAGGIECSACARKNFITAPIQIRQSTLLLPMRPERLKELSVKSWSQPTATSPVLGQWRQAPNMWRSAAIQSELQQRLSYEFDRPNGTDRIISEGCFTLPAQDKNKKDYLPEKLACSNINRTVLDRTGNGNTAFERTPPLTTFRREEGNINGLQDSGLLGESDHISARKGVVSDPSLNGSAGVNFEAHQNSHVNISLSSSVLKEDPPAALLALVASFPPPHSAKDMARVSATPTHQDGSSPLLVKQLHSNPHNGPDSCGELQSQVRNGRLRAEGRGRNHLLPRYWPRITDQELQQISGNSNSVITPLFEKVLSASDAGRIGRLVLPKKCAEAYFPPISQPEGLPLKVQDSKGKEWIFQFRFWPNNNSRMYVLEGVTPCIQSMQLQAGDTVTFSRLDPEMKLVMGFRKASNAMEQDLHAVKAGNGYSTTQDVSNRNGKSSEIISSPPLHPSKSSPESTNLSNTSGQATWSTFDKTGFIQKEGTASKSSLLPGKRKSSILGSKSKRLRIENEDSIELKLTWEEAQELLRPPPNHVPSVVMIEGHEFEEYEEPPILGKPTIFTINQTGDKNQWTQCEDCSKWRKLPADALLPPRWRCSDNSWDPGRSSCSSAQEITTQQLEDLVPSSTASHFLSGLWIVSSKKSKAKVESNSVEALDGLDTLANLAIMAENETASPSQPTTKHPRHRPGCTCIVCIQPPSGKGPKHKQTCQCNVCLTVKRRFHTLMLRKEKREKEAEVARMKQQQIQSPDKLSQMEDNQLVESKIIISSETERLGVMSDGAVVDEDLDRRKALPSPIKTTIDLNIQPEREDEPSPVPDAGSMMRALRDATA